MGTYFRLYDSLLLDSYVNNSRLKAEAIHSSSKHPSIPEGCRLGAVTFIQRFGKALNPHFHFHSCVIDDLPCGMHPAL
ncbi:MAG: transposase [Parachlamydiales bacterium]|nr:transposase [Parachlamydiales bacterium]